MPRPPRELKGFTRVELKPGESRPVSFMMQARDVCYYDITSKTWKADHGKFEIAVGASSRDLRLRGQYDLIGGVAGAATAKTVLLP